MYVYVCCCCSRLLACVVMRACACVHRRTNVACCQRTITNHAHLLDNERAFASGDGGSVPLGISELSAAGRGKFDALLHHTDMPIVQANPVYHLMHSVSGLDTPPLAAESDYADLLTSL